ncbi:MAG: cyclic nucleotide-binding domain-containing protein [Verrucomicrobiales bacterium]|nr:cyclic nucleotide-binding domain-containing protein [Verrucomicrobiales bacterium]
MPSRKALSGFSPLDRRGAKSYISSVQEFAYIHDENNVPETLMEVPFLEAFSKEHLDQVLHASAFIECDPGDVIIAEGDEASRIFILLAGEIAVMKGGDQLVKMNQTGDIFGELAALEDEVRSASIVAVKEAFCLAVDQKFLEHVMPKDENAPFYAALYEFIAKLTTKRLKATSAYLATIDTELRALKKAAK